MSCSLYKHQTPLHVKTTCCQPDVDAHIVSNILRSSRQIATRAGLQPDIDRQTSLHALSITPVDVATTAGRGLSVQL